MTFDEACELDPRIHELFNDVAAYSRLNKRKRVRCANAAWYGYGMAGFKPRLLKLVGWEREPPGYVEPAFPPWPGEAEGKQFVVVAMSDPIWDEREKARRVAMDEATKDFTKEQLQAERKLGSKEAYDLVYDTMYELLPDCRNCSCL